MAPPGDDPTNEAVKAVQESNLELLKQNQEEAKRLLDLLRSQKELDNERIDLTAKHNELLEKQETLRLAGKELSDTENAQLERYTSKMGILNAQIESNGKERAKAEAKYGELVEANIEKKLEEAEIIKEQIEDYERLTGVLTKLPGVFGKIGGQIQKAAKVKQDLAKMGNTITELGAKFNSPKLAKFGLRFQKGMQAAGTGVVAFGLVGFMAFAKISKAIFETAVKVDNLSRSISTGLGKTPEQLENLESTFTGLAKETAASGVTMEEAGEAFKAMISNVSSFNSLNSVTQKKVSGTIAKLQKLGIAATESADAIDYFTRGLNMSASQAADLTAQIALMGQQSGITSKEMMKNFTELNSRISVFGKDSTKVLKNLSIQARAAGVSVGSLTGITSKFDQFDSAVESVAMLNAVIGTNIDAVALMSLTDDQQIDVLIRQIRARTGSIDTLDKHTQRLIANQLGVQSVAEAQQLINMDPSEFEAYNKELKEQEDIQNQLAEQTKQLVPIFDRFKIQINEMLLEFAPLAQQILNAIEYLLGFKDEIAGTIAFLTGFVGIGGTVVGILKLITIAFGLATFPISGTTAAIVALVAGLATLWGWFTISGSPHMYEMPQVIGKNFETMGDMASSAGEMLKKPIDALHGMWDIFHKSGSPDLYELPQTFADNFASIEQSVKGTMGSLTKFITVMKDFASLDYDGFVAIKSDGTGTSMVMGSEGIIKQMSEGRLQVDVKMPEIKMPEINIEVIFKDQKLEGIIEAKVAEMVGGAS